MNESGMFPQWPPLAATLAGLAPPLPVVVELAGMPLGVLFDPDSYYFGFARTRDTRASASPPVQMAQPSRPGMHTTGFPGSPLTPAAS
jgi:CitMHS family citrate-Mg2+:H+ or citrate-Ca2+:H+ symporter